MLCNKDTVCSNNVISTQFKNSVAGVKGGAIYYDLYRPKLDNITQLNNTAVYGNYIASYPIKIKLTNTNTDLIRLDNVVSGQVYSSLLEFELVDHDGQVISTDNSSTIKINTIHSSTSLDGTLVVAVNHGVAVFDQLTLISKPGSQNVEFGIVSEAIDNDIINLQYNGTVTQNNITTSFRYCESGEIEVDDKCVV